jgi:hypothetical protein
VDEVERALSQIADIHAQLTASSRFRGFAPAAMAFNAVLSLSVALAQTAWPQLLADDPMRYVTVWGATLAAATAVSAGEAISRSRRVHGPMADTLLGSALQLLLPFIAAGIIIAAAVCMFSPASAWMLPGLWLILVGLAGFALASSLPPAIRWAAGWFFVSGAIVFGLGARGGALSPWTMGLPFTIGLASVAFIFQRGNGGRDVRK